MLTLASFVLEKTGGDAIGDVVANLDAYRARIARAPEAPVAGGVREGAPAREDAGEPVHGLTGSDEAGSGGDD
jgi:hypothetical protein